MLMVDQLRFYDAKERLGDSVVPAVPLTAHALDEPMLVQQLSEIMAGILNPAIRMDDQSGAGARRRRMARCRAAWTIWLPNVLLSAHPTTIRENRSRNTVRYSHPRSVAM